MVSALICTHSDLEADLGNTLLWREGVDRQIVSRQDQAMMMAVAARPSLVVVDRDLPWAARLVTSLREDPTTRPLSIVVVARGDFDPAEIELLEAGANAILRIPAGPEWNDRLQRLIDVPVRKDARFPATFRVLGAVGPEGPEPALALNLSVAGVLLETLAPLQTWDELDLELRLPAPGSKVRVHGRVVRLAGPRVFGVELVSYEGDGQDAVRRFLGTLGSP